MKQRKILTMNNFKGIDYSSSPHEVSPYRSVDSRNMIVEDGVLKKRAGWRQLFSCSQRINGMHWCTENEILLVHTGTEIIAYQNGMPDMIKARTEEGAKINDAPSSFVEQRGRVYIFCGDLLVFGKLSSDDQYEFRRMVDLDDLYLPTTTINIKGIGEKGSDETNVAVLESPNLLNPFRINKMMSSTYDQITMPWNGSDEFESGTANPIGSPARTGFLKEMVFGTGNYFFCFKYVLDAPMDEDSDIIIEKKGVDGKVFRYRNFFSQGGIAGDPSLNLGKRYIYRVNEDGSIYVDNLMEKAFRGWVVFNSETSVNGAAVLYMIFDGETMDMLEPDDAYSDVTVKFRTAVESKKITGCTIVERFGTGGETDRLFVSGNPDHPNMIFFSGFGQFDYFGTREYLVAGGDNSAVNGFIRMSDTTLAALKEPGSHDYSIFYITERNNFQHDADGLLISGQTSFAIQGGGEGSACLNGRTAFNLLGDPLMLTEEGVVGIFMPADSTTGERFVKERSYSINARSIQNLSSAHGITYRGRYYLAVNDEEQSCFVADSKNRYTRSGNDLDSSYNYEWWHWTNIPARVFYALEGASCIIVDGEWNGISPDGGEDLLFGTEDGRICAMRRECFYDRTEEKLSNGSITVSTGNKAITYDSAIEVMDGDQIKFSTDVYVKIVDDIIEKKDPDGWYKVSDEDIVKLSLSQRYMIYLPDGDGYEECSIEEIDLVECKIKMSKPVGEDFSLIMSLKDRQLYIVNLAEENFQMSLDQGGEPIQIHSYDPLLLSGILIREMPIRSRWITPYFDMGSALYAKTLQALCITAGSESRGLHFGYQTKRKNQMKKLSENGSMDLSKFSFIPGEFSVDNSFPASYTVRMNVRNFTYIRFVFESDSASPCSVHALTALYKINNMNRGLR